MFLLSEFFPLNGFAHESLWKTDGVLWDPLFSLEDYLKNYKHHIEIILPENVTLKYPHLISIGQGTTIEPNVYIEGPCIIGKNCTIRHGAYLRSNVILGDRVTVGHGSEVKNSVMMNQAVAAHLCYVGDSILGPNANLGAGVKCSNLRLDRQEIYVKYQEQKIHTGLVKLGSILGSGVQVGCNAVLNPGTFVGKDSFICPLMNIGGYIPSGVHIRPSQNWVVETRPEKILQNLKKYV
ncbi:MAG TPA: LpxA family transferase [Chlamydiales bacterium]|nr:LpxA family transferase [Chlamydiales bacterium]